MTSLVNCCLTHRATVALFTEAPQELLAERTERWLTEELRHETVTVHLVNPVKIQKQHINIFS